MSGLSTPEQLSSVQLKAILAGVLDGSDWTPFYVEKIKAAFAQAERALPSETDATVKALAKAYVAEREELLAALSAIETPHWIPLYAQRPEGLQDVLAVCISTNRVVVQSAIRIRQLWADALEHGEECAYTHWQEMPEAP